MACTSVTTCRTGATFDLTYRGTIAVPRYVVPKPRTVVLRYPGTRNCGAWYPGTKNRGAQYPGTGFVVLGTPGFIGNQLLVSLV